MNVLQIIAAPNPKKAVFYNPVDKIVYFESADLIGVVEFEDPDGSGMVANLASYLCTDKLGFYMAPQMQLNFLDIIDNSETELDLGKYKKSMELITEAYKEFDKQFTDVEAVRVENKGNLSKILRMTNKLKDKEQEDTE